MRLVNSEQSLVRHVPPGQPPEYGVQNPVFELTREIEEMELAAGREYYRSDSLQFLFPFQNLSLYGPSGDAWEQADPRWQDNKEDFQKQNVAGFELRDMRLVRGYVSVGGWTGAFLKLSYRGTPDSALAQAAGASLGDAIHVWLRVGSSELAEPVRVPYNPRTHRFEIEFWADPGFDLNEALCTTGRAALAAGLIRVSPEIVRGTPADFSGPEFDRELDGLNREQAQMRLYDRAPEHTMHPVRPLALEVAWSDQTGTAWDSCEGANHRVEFGMLQRGPRNALATGLSAEPHGGAGFVHYRNLFTNYFGHEAKLAKMRPPGAPNELGRDVQPWSFPAGGGEKCGDTRRETFFSLDYMDLNILSSKAAIGLHRHRDNQEFFFIVEGWALMVVGDWAEHPHRQRAFEIRTLTPGEVVLTKNGQLHALINIQDDPCVLLSFGGYD